MTITRAELTVRRPVKVKGGLERKVYHTISDVLVGFIFEPDGAGAGYAYCVGPRRWRGGSRDNPSKVFKSIKAAAIALAGQL